MAEDPPFTPQIVNSGGTVGGVRTCVRLNVVCALADVVATKLGIIFLSSSPKICDFWLALVGGVCALWVSEHPPRRTHILKCC